MATPNFLATADMVTPLLNVNHLLLVLFVVAGLMLIVVWLCSFLVILDMFTPLLAILSAVFGHSGYGYVQSWV